MKPPVLGADETGVKLWGNGLTLGFLTDPSTGEIMRSELPASREGEEPARWMVKAAKRFGAKVLVSDELCSRKTRESPRRGSVLSFETWYRTPR